MAFILNLVGVGLGLLLSPILKSLIGVRMRSLDIELRLFKALEDSHTSQAEVAERKLNSTQMW